jgi:hypothetical protein
MEITMIDFEFDFDYSTASDFDLGEVVDHLDSFELGFDGEME